MTLISSFLSETMLAFHLDSPMLTFIGIFSISLLLVVLIEIEILRFSQRDDAKTAKKIGLLRGFILPLGISSGLIILSRFLIMLRIL